MIDMYPKDDDGEPARSAETLEEPFGICVSELQGSG